MTAPLPPPDTLAGVLERILFFNEENHYTIAEFRAEGREPRVTIVGVLPGVQCGETLHLRGQWTHHALHGDQFKVEAFRSELPSSVYGIRKYLGSGLVDGVGPVYAHKIVDAFGTDTFRVLSEDSARLRTVPGIGKVRAAAIKRAWDEQRAFRELYIFLQTYGVTTGQCAKLIKHYGPAAQRVLSEEPYRVAREIEGIGFKTADRIAINLGYANDAPPRLEAGLLFALDQLQEEGHTAVLASALTEFTTPLLQTESALLTARILDLAARSQLIRHPLEASGASEVADDLPRGRAGNPVPAAPTPKPPPASTAATKGLAALPSSAHATSASVPPRSVPSVPAAAAQVIPTPIPTAEPDTWVQLPALDRAERRIAEAIRRLLIVGSVLPPIKADAAVVWAEQKAGLTYAAQQRQGLRHALTAKVSILTGGPGTGKTTILRALVEILKAKKVRVHLAAPTGRAAQRLSETTGGFASTIHRLLKFDAASGGFLANEHQPLATDFLIVDEASMLDTRLAAALLQAVPSRAHLLLVGDIDQLPSVGAGNVLQDLIAVHARLGPRSRASSLTAALTPPLPVTRLDIIYRQQGQSQIVTTAHAINAGDATLPPSVGDLAALPAWADLSFIVADGAEDTLRKVLQLCTDYLPREHPWLKPSRDVQVLAPMHKGQAGVGNLNLQLQAALNPHAPALRGPHGEYRTGDKVIQLRNDYEKGLFNGDIGTITGVDAEAGTLTAEFDGAAHGFQRADLPDLALAYAISIHKSQGSEYPVVIVPLLKAHFMMLQRNLLYTAITRGKKKVYLVGEPAAYAMAVRANEARIRGTHLRAKLLATARTP